MQFCATQAMSAPVVMSITHWMPHWMSEPPPVMHWVTQATSAAHWGSLLHAVSWEQQLCAVHCPHADPSDPHVFAPHTPALQLLLQQSEGIMQAAPFAEHCPPQIPLWQSLLQQGLAAEHSDPSGPQGGVTQVPPVQVPEPEQHGIPASHA
jgi:hypothetical protein